MSENTPDIPEGPPGGPGGVGAEAVIKKSRRFSIVWVVPIVAAVAAAFVAWKAISEQGPAVTLIFPDADGIEVEKTKIKYKSVEVGVVEEISFTQDLDHVQLTARLVKGAEPFLTENTRFWIVRAEISAGNVTGLGTVLSGAYIAVDLSDEGERQTNFVGLEQTPIVTSEDEGSLYSLRSRAAVSLQVGAPVYYRAYEVGKVVSYELDPSAEFFSIGIYVRAPYDRQITTETRFWNASGLDVVVNAEGVRIDTPSLVSALIGGVSFDNFDTLPPGGPVGESKIFRLYENKDASLKPEYGRKNRYYLHFEESVSGLTVGAPVEFRGIKLGEVLDVKLTYDYREGDFRVPVLIELEPDRITPVGTPDEEPAGKDRDLAYLVKRGLRAQLATGNILTGQLKIELDFHDEAEPAEISYEGFHPTIPTAPRALDEIASSLADVVGQIREVPLSDIGQKLDRILGEVETTVKQVNALTADVNEEIVPSLAGSLENLERTLESTDSVIGPDSAVNAELERLVLDLGDAARSMRLLTERLEQHPEELLRGKR